MDIFNRPPTISDDSLHYTIHLPSHLSDQSSVTSFAAHIRSFVDTSLPNFLWNRDPFELKVVENPDLQHGWLLEGTMRVGDCVDDEWCVVWLLREISKTWDLAISVYDSDGEFLLIEAAEALPKWVTPDNSENRVWIYGSRMHLIPISYVSPPSSKRRRRTTLRGSNSDDEGLSSSKRGEDDDEYITESDALKLLKDTDVDTFAPRSVESLVWRRISGYPAASKEHVHLTKAWLPVGVAKALSVDPSLVQKPVEAFYTRDAIQLRAAHRMSRFPPEPSVLTTVKMTRTAYAQLVGQKFYPPKIFGRWTEREGEKAWRWRDVGMKLACGFEMLYQENKDTVIPDSSPEARLRNARSQPNFQKFIDNLKTTTYFRGEVEGSALWKQLEASAAETYLQSAAERSSIRPSFTVLVEQALSRAPKVFTPSTLEEDSEDWLNVDAENFDQLLEQTMGSGGAKTATKSVNNDAMDVDGESMTAEDRLANDQATKLRDLASKVSQFVEGQGDLEGAKFSDENDSSGDEDFSDGMPSTDSDDEDSDDGSGVDDKMKDTDNLEDSVARLAAMDNLVPAIDPSDYGKMPASFHSNSQRLKPTTNEAAADGAQNEDVQEDDGKFAQKHGIDSRDLKDKASQSPNSKPIRQPILPRDEYDGVVDSDDEEDDEMEEEDEEDEPQLVGEVEVDMGEEEAEFLEFARDALGISNDQWSEIIQNRRDRGVFVPDSAKDVQLPSATSKVPPEAINSSLRVPAPGPRPNVNPNLDSFEAVMQAMDAELQTRRRGTSATQHQDHEAKDKANPRSMGGADKGKARADMEETEEDIENIEQAMEAELKAALDRGEEDGEDMEWGGEGMDYNMIKNFLESFKSQAGLSGPVGNLAGRLQHGWLPRDDSAA